MKAPPPTPAPGQRWIGGANSGHAFGLVEVIQVSKLRVRVRFLDGPKYGKLVYLYRYQFVIQWVPA
jgi:hypothetical protein